MRTPLEHRIPQGPDGKALYDALERTPAEVLDEEKAEQRRSRMKIFRRHQPRHAEGAETDADAETAAMEFRSMKDIEAALESGGALKHYQPAPGQTGPQPAVRPTGPQPRFTPNSQTGPQPRHRNETGRILDIAHRRADRVPVPEPPAITSAAAFAQNADRIGQIPLPGCDASDGYGSIPAHVAYMRRVSYFTGTSSRFEHPGAWPLPVAPLVRQRKNADDTQVAITVEGMPEPEGDAA